MIPGAVLGLVVGFIVGGIIALLPFGQLPVFCAVIGALAGAIWGARNQ